MTAKKQKPGFAIVPQTFRLLDPGEADATTLGTFLPDAPAPEAAKPTARGWGEAAKDTGLGVMSSLAGLVKTGGDLYGLASGDMDNAASQLGRDGQAYWEDAQSDVLKDKKRAHKEAIDAADGVGGKFLAAAGGILSDPALLMDTVAGNVATVIPGMAAGRVAAGALMARAMRVGPLTEAMTATAAKAAAKLGTGVAVGTGAVQQGADVSADVYADVMKKTPAELAQNPEFVTRVQSLMQAGHPEADAVGAARQEFATMAARATFAPAAGISVLANTMPGGTMLERALVGGAARDTIKAGTKYAMPKAIGKGMLGEGVQETLEEGGGAFAGNVAKRELVDPNQSLSDGVGENAGLGFAGGVAMGGPGGAFHREDHAPQPKPKSPGDEVREQAVPESGPLSRAANNAIEGAAQAVDMAGQAAAGLAATAAAAPPIAPPAAPPAPPAAVDPDTDLDTGEVAPPAAAPLAPPPSATFDSYEAAADYLSTQRRNNGSLPGGRWAPAANEDGTFGLVNEKDERFKDAEALRATKAQEALGIQSGDILAKSGQPFKNRGAATQEQRRRGIDTHEVAQLGEGAAYVVRPRAAAEPAPAVSPTAPPVSPTEATAAAPAPATHAEGETLGQAEKAGPELDMGQEAGGDNPPVELSGKRVQLTPDQRKAWNTLDEDYRGKFNAAKQRFDRLVKNPLPDNPDFGLRNAREQYDVEKKTLGMQLSAERRRLAGMLTDKELAHDAALESRLRAGDVAMHGGQRVTVESPAAFGKVKIKMANGVVKSVPHADLKKTAPEQAPAAIEGAKLDDEWTAFAPESGTLGIPRVDMPQIKAEHRGAMVNFLAARGITHEQTEIPAAELKPTQAEFSPAKVAKAQAFEGGDRSILVSSDGHVLDGHHQWMGKRAGAEPVKVIRLNAPIQQLLETVKEFPSAETAAGATVPAGEAAQAQPGAPKPGGEADLASRWAGMKPAVRRAKLLGSGFAKADAEQVKELAATDWTALPKPVRVALADSLPSTPKSAEAAPTGGADLSGPNSPDPGAPQPFKNAPDRGIVLAAQPVAAVEPAASKQMPADGPAETADAAKDAQAFVAAPDGSLDFGEISTDMSKAMRRQAGKIRLQRGDGSFGEQHIEARHGDEIRGAGFESVAAFVAEIARNIEQIVQPKKTSQLVVVQSASNDRVLFIQLTAARDEAGDFYTVRSAFPARSNYLKNKGWTVLWDGRAQPSAASGSVPPFAEPPLNSGEAATIPSGQSEASVMPADAGAKSTRTAKPDAEAIEVDAGNSGTAATETKPARLTDAGDELSNNRRNKVSGISWADVEGMNDTLKIKSVTKATVWPKPNYARLVEDGAPAWKMAVLKAIYDKLAATPAAARTLTDEQMREYIETMSMIRDAVLAELDRVGDEPVQRVVGQTPTLSAEQWRESANQAKLLSDLRGEFDAAKVFGKVFPVPADAKPGYGAPSAFDRGSEQGKANNRKALLVGGNNAIQGLQFSYKTMSKARDLLLEGFPAKQEAWEKSYEVRASELRDNDVPEAERTGEPQSRFQVFEKGSRWRLAKGHPDGGFATEEAAQAFARTLVAKTKTDKPLPPSRGLDLADVQRTGPDWRKGRNVTADDVKQAFGFRGVNLGEYVKANQKIAQIHLNHAFEALHDLADLMGVPPKAISLNGTLGLAIGAQGSGRALAHFVPGVNEINITRDSGAGALAHEWAHAFDHYLGVQQGGATARSAQPFLSESLDARNGAGQVRPEVFAAFKTMVGLMKSRAMTEAETRDWLAQQRQSAAARLKRLAGVEGAKDEAAKTAALDKLLAGEPGDEVDGMPAQVRAFAQAAGMGANSPRLVDVLMAAQRVADLRDETRFLNTHRPQARSDYDKASGAMDASRDKPYWSTPREMLARAFEAYVIDALAERQRESLYLSGLANSKSWQDWSEKNKGLTPFIQGDERLAFGQAAQTLLGTLITREDEAGNVALFNRKEDGYTGADGQPGDPNDTVDADNRRDVERLGASISAHSEDTRDAGTVRPYAGARLPDHSALGEIAGAFGARIAGFRLRDGLSETDQKRFGFFNGVFLKGGGRPVIYINAATDRPHMAVLGHELAHYLRSTKPGLYERLVVALAPYIDDTRYAHWRKTSAVSKGVKSETGAQEEFIGEVLSDGLLNSDFWRTVARKNKPLFAKIYSAVSQVLSKIAAKLSLTPKTEHIVTDFKRVMEIAGEVMAEFGLGDLVDEGGGLVFNRAEDRSSGNAQLNPSAEQHALKALSESDALFQLPKSDMETVEGITADHSPNIKVSKSTAIPGETRYNFTLRSGKTARLMVRAPNPYGPSTYGFDYADGEMSSVLHERPGDNPEDVPPTGDVWIDVSLLESGDEGRTIYNIASTYAHNTGRIFIGDPAGLSDEAMRRRPELMLSSALKFGTTAHLAPHPRQITGDSQLGIPPLRWVYGDDLGNIQRLIDLNLKGLENAGLDAISYDPPSGQFRDSENQPIDRAGIAELAKSGYGRGALAGGGTLSRGAVLRALSSKEGGAVPGVGPDRAGLLGRLLRQSAVHPQSTSELFYNRRDDGAGDGNRAGLNAGARAPQSQATLLGRLESAATGMRLGQLAVDLLPRNTFGLWARTVGTQRDKAITSPLFKRTYDAAQAFIHDTSYFANTAADLAPSLLPRLESFKDLGSRLKLTQADSLAVAKAVFSGTLEHKKEFTPAELREQFQLSDGQVALYQQFRAAVGLSLDQLAAAEALRAVGKEATDDMRAMVSAGDYAGFEQAARAIAVDRHSASLRKVRDLKKAQRTERAALEKAQAKEIGSKEGRRPTARLVLDGQHQAAMQELERRHEKARAEAEAEKDAAAGLEWAVVDKFSRVAALKQEGYAPLMRFGKHSVHVQGEDGETLYFGLYESTLAANQAARQLRAEFGDEAQAVEVGVMSQEAYKAFKGVSPETLAIFGDASGLGDNEAFQKYLKLATANHSALRRLIHRKGVAGFSEDTGRVLAAFITSNARRASGIVHLGELKQSVEDARASKKGDVADEAFRLAEYVQNPTEEAALVKNLLFVNFIGGSVASALVNLTQPLTMTLPYLSQFSSPVKASADLLRAAKEALGPVRDPELKAALARAEAEGIVAPQEMHELQQASQRSLMNHPWARKGLFLWGSLFQLAEAMNRRVSFIAAYRTAAGNEGLGDPFAFASEAVDATQGVYNKANRPNWARGALPGVLMTFKQFSIAYMEFFKRLPLREKGLAMAVLILTAGLQGLPGADDLDDVIDTIGQRLGYNTNAKAWKREVLEQALGKSLAGFALRGATGLPGSPIDVAGRMSVGNLLPATGLLRKDKQDKIGDLAEIGGAAGGLLKQIGNLADGNIKGALPVSLSNLAKALDMAATGAYRDTRGRKVVDTSPLEAIVKGIGFQPGVVAQEQRRASELQQTVSMAKGVQADVSSLWADGIYERDADKVARARQQLADWNRDNPDSRIVVGMPGLLKRVREMRASRAERLTKSTPKGMRPAVREALAN